MALYLSYTFRAMSDVGSKVLSVSIANTTVAGKVARPISFDFEMNMVCSHYCFQSSCNLGVDSSDDET